MKKNLFTSFSNVSFGKNVQISKFVNLYGCKIGDNTKIGAFVEIQKNVIVGKNCKISSHSFICEGVSIEDNVFVGHNVTFINDKYPKAVNRKGELKNDQDWKLEKTTVCKNVSIGSSVTILCGVTIGSGSMIGAGTVLTKNVPENVIVIGVPGKIVKKIK
jgi:acetyltransferase-like isoleucine patch superfamily enzyme